MTEHVPVVKGRRGKGPRGRKAKALKRQKTSTTRPTHLEMP